MSSEELKESGSTASLADASGGAGMLARQYSEPNLRRPQALADVGRESSSLYHVYGSDMTRRGTNLFFIEDTRIIYAVGNSVVFEDVVTKGKKYLLGLDDGGVGCVAVHPSRTLFAVGGKGFQPKIYIYTYPEMKIRNVLSGGAERGFASLQFNKHGNKLASVAMSPDYMLTVWDWEEELIGLHAKAFGQDVFTVRFSIDDERRLTTCGTGHIRFWKMAATFTGLKLQGSIGKFGKVELSDIEAFVELPDGKVVSGTELGALLLWEGNFIKCRFVQVGGKPCHDGEITYVELDRKEKCLITASVDGFIRWWDLEAIDTAEVDSDVSMNYELFPVAEYNININSSSSSSSSSSKSSVVGIRTMVDGGAVGLTRSFIIIDTLGKSQVLKFNLLTSSAENGADLTATLAAGPGKLSASISAISASAVTADSLAPPDTVVLSEFHCGAITGMDASPTEHLATTCGADGSVRAWDYVSRKMIACKYYGAAGTVLRWMPSALDPSGKQVLVGFADGIVRLLLLGDNEEGYPTFVRKMVFKPHNGYINDMAFSPNNELLVTAGKDGTVFFFKCREKNGPNGSWTPLRFFTVSPGQTGKNAVMCEKISWRADSAAVMCSCSDGVLREVDVSWLQGNVPMEIESYEEFFPMREFVGKLPVAPVMANSSSQAVLASAGDSSDTPSGESKEASESHASPTAPSSPSKGAQNDAPVEIPLVPLKVSAAIYSIGRKEGGIFVGGTVAAKGSSLYEYVFGEEAPVKELTLGVYSNDDKGALKVPLPTAFRYGPSNNFLCVGASDGSVVMRPRNYPEVFLRVAAHNGGVTAVTNSFDDKFILSAGKDGTFAVHHVLLDFVNKAADALFKDLDAGVFGEQVVKVAKPAPKGAVAVEEPATLRMVSSEVKLEEFVSLEPPTLPAVVAQDDDKADLPAGSYSIQDAKLKSEQDAKLVTADEVKDRVRSLMKTLQRDYENIVRENETIPAAVRLGPAEMDVDGEYFELLRQQGSEMVAEVHRECAHDAEKALRLRQKIISRMMEGMLVEEMTLSAFKRPGVGSSAGSNSIVRSIRSQGLPDSVLDIVKAVQKQTRQDEIASQNQPKELMLKATVTDLSGALLGGEMAGELGADGGAATDLAGEAADQQKGHSAAARRENRRLRKAKLSEHRKEKPSEDDDDERDVTAISIAEKTVGDYKLKSGEDYEVPEKQRVNADKKRNQMALLEESMLKMRLYFNERFLAMRNLKKEIVYSIKRSNVRIREIDAELLQPEKSELLWEPSLDVTEFPDDRDEITEDELAAFQQERKKTAWAKTIPPPHSVITGTKSHVTRSFSTGEVLTEIPPQAHNELVFDLNIKISDQSQMEKALEKVDVPPRSYEVSDTVLQRFIIDPLRGKEGKRIAAIESVVPVLIYARAGKKTKMVIESKTREQEQSKANRRRLLEFERKMLLKKIDENVKAFEEAIDQLRTDRHALTADLKLAQLKLLVLYQEYQLLLTFESRDLALQQKQIKSQGEKADITSNSMELKSKLESRLEEMKGCQERNAVIVADLKLLIPENHPYGEQLGKIFRKKIKRNKPGEEEPEEDQEEEDEEDDEGEEEEETDDACPPGCDPSLHEKVIELREKRIDLEELMAEVQKGLDESKKALDRLKQREKQVIKEVSQAELEIKQFHRQKQAALNQIEIVVPLSLSQLYVFNSSGVLSGPDANNPPAPVVAVEEKKAVEPEDGGGEVAAALPVVDEELMNAIAILKNPMQRELVTDISMTSHVLIRKHDLAMLENRIGELKMETEEARVNFRELRQERVRLGKERDKQRQKIENWGGKVKDLQMLKFGRAIDLDELEAGSDRTREEEAEKGVREQEEAFQVMVKKLTKEGEKLQSKLSEAMSHNTAMLNAVADLTETKLAISRELNAPGNAVSTEGTTDNMKEREDRQKVVAYVQLQAREIEALRAELTMLKRKEAPPILIPNNAPIPPISSSSFQEGQSGFLQPQGSLVGSNYSGMRGGEGILPPIPGVSKSSMAKR